MKILQWPKQEVLREKLLHYGASTLSDAELLAIFIQIGSAKFNALHVARNAIQELGSLRMVLNASKNQLMKLPGIGEARVALIEASKEIHRRQLTESMKARRCFSCVDDASDYLHSTMRDHKKEVFNVLMLDSQHRLISNREMFNGTINSAAVYPREIVIQALEDNAAAVILAHNHPSGDPEPSDADKNITKRIIKALALVDIPVLDHFVIGDKAAVSFAQRGLMSL